MASGRDPTATTLKPDDTMKTVATLCSCNQKCEVSEFCKDHQELVCSTCASVKHRGCKVSSIEEMAKSEYVARTFNSMVEKIGDLANKALEMKSQQASCINGLLEVETRCETEIHNFKADIINWVDKLETNALADLHSKIENQKAILQLAGDPAGDASKLLTVDQKMIENAKKSQNKRQMFISNIEIGKSLKHYETALSETESKLNVPNIEFKSNKNIITVMQETDLLGEVTTPKCCNFLTLQDKRTKSVNVKHTDDQNAPQVAGIAFVNNGDILCADYNNSRLTLLDSELKSKESSKCSAQPWDIAVIDRQEVIVSFPSAKMLQYYTVSPKLQAGRCINISGETMCWGVKVINDRIYVSRKYYIGTPDIIVIDAAGKLLKRMTESDIGNKFNYAYFLALNSSGSKIHLSDFGDNQLICMTPDDNHIFTYTDPELKCPRGLLVDDDDNVLITGQGSNNIHVVKSDGTKHKILLTSSDDIHEPVGMAYDFNTNTLVVGGWGYEKLMIFKFQQS